MGSEVFVGTAPLAMSRAFWSVALEVENFMDFQVGGMTPRDFDGDACWIQGLSALLSSAADINLMTNLVDHLTKLVVCFDLIVDALVGMDHGRVIAPAKLQANSLEGVLR